MLLPSPTKASVRPASGPSRSFSVMKSASAWQGCCSSVSALMTWRRSVAAANSSSTRCEKVRMTTASTHRSRFLATSATGSRRPSATSGCSAMTCAAQLPRGDLERRPRPQRRLLEQHRHVAAREELRGRGMRPRATARLSSGSPARCSARDRRRRSRRTDRKCLRGREADRAVLVWSHVRYSALIRTYSALRSQVQTVDDAAPAPRSTDTVMSVPRRYSAASAAASS